MLFACNLDELNGILLNSLEGRFPVTTLSDLSEHLTFATIWMYLFSVSSLLS